MNQQRKNRQIALNWIAAFNEHDLKKLLNLYDEEATHYSPKLKLAKPATNGKIVGKPQLKLWWEEAFVKLPSLLYEPVNLMADENQVFMEYIRKVDNEPDTMVAEVLIMEKGLIVQSKVYHG